MTWILLISAAMALLSALAAAGSAIAYTWADSDLAYKVGITAIIIAVVMGAIMMFTLAAMSM